MSDDLIETLAANQYALSEEEQAGLVALEIDELSSESLLAAAQEIEEQWRSNKNRSGNELTGLIKAPFDLAAADGLMVDVLRDQFKDIISQLNTDSPLVQGGERTLEILIVAADYFILGYQVKS